MGPFNWFLSSHSSCKLESQPSSGGIDPVSFLFLRLSSVTRCGVPPTVTPFHSATGLSNAQFSVAVPRSVPRDATSASQSDTKPGLFAGSGTAIPVEQVA